MTKNIVWGNTLDNFDNEVVVVKGSRVIVNTRRKKSAHARLRRAKARSCKISEGIRLIELVSSGEIPSHQLTEKQHQLMVDARRTQLQHNEGVRRYQENQGTHRQVSA